MGDTTMPKKNGTATYDQLAILASSVGLVEKTNEGRQAFVAWLSTDQKAARAALFGRVAARRVAASGTRSITAAERQAAGSGHPTHHGMRVPRSVGASVVRSATAQQPAPAARVSGPRITEAGDR
jgi:hypothetical protein